MRTIKFLFALLACGIFALQAYAQSRIQTTVYFGFDSFKLYENEAAKVDSILKLKDSLVSFKISVWGHTDNIGSIAYNEALALKRANTVKIYLKQKGIPDSLISTASYGKNQPVANNTSLHERKLNRRAEVIIMAEKSMIAQTTDSVPPPPVPTDSIIRKSLPNLVIVEGSYKWITTNEALLAGTGNVPLVRNTKEIMLNQLNTVSTDGLPLTSNVMMCVPGVTECELTKPVTFYILVQENFCVGDNAKVYKQVKDTKSTNSFWTALGDAEFETIEGKRYFKYTTYNLCPPCVNLACTVSEWDSIYIKVKPKKFKVEDFKTVYETSNAVILAEQTDKNTFLIKKLKFENAEPQIITRLSRGSRKEFINKKLSTFKYSEKKKAYIIRKKDMK